MRDLIVNNGTIVGHLLSNSLGYVKTKILGDVNRILKYNYI